MEEARPRSSILYVSIYVVFKTVGTEKTSVIRGAEGGWGGIDFKEIKDLFWEIWNVLYLNCGVGGYITIHLSKHPYQKE